MPYNLCNSCKKSDLCNNIIKHSKLSINNKCFSLYHVRKMQLGASYPRHLDAGCLHKAMKEKGKQEKGENDYIHLLDFSNLFW